MGQRGNLKGKGFGRRGETRRIVRRKIGILVWLL